MGILIASDSEIHMNELTIKRTSASLPYGGRYRMIDFALSNLVNSGISTIGIVTRNNYNSLMDHLRMGRDWDLNRKNSGLTLFPPFAFNTLRDVYKGKVEAIYTLKGYMMSQKKLEYVVLGNANVICNIDVEEIVDEHIARGADVTMLTKKPTKSTRENKSSRPINRAGLPISALRSSPANRRNSSTRRFTSSKKTCLLTLSKTLMQGDCRTLKKTFF